MCNSRLAAETTCVLLLGGLLALAANTISPRGLDLARDYFPAAPAVAPVVTAAATPSPVPQPARSHEFNTVTLAQIAEIIRDTRHTTRQILLIDARDAQTCQTGHIPGAVHFDPFRPEQTLAGVLPMALAAQSVILYCGGVDCDHARIAARLLRDLGVPAQRLAIFDGGYEEWQNANQSTGSPPSRSQRRTAHCPDCGSKSNSEKPKNE